MRTGCPTKLTSKLIIIKHICASFFQDEMQNNSKANYRLTREDIISNIFVFMAAEYATTSTALAYATYALARYSEVQKKLQAEIDQLSLGDNKNFNEETIKYLDYDIVTQMPYMNMFISEVLRMFPIANGAVQREKVQLIESTNDII